MKSFFTHKYYPWLISGLGILLFSIAFFLYLYFDHFFARLFRLLICIIYFGIFLLLKSKNRLFLFLFAFSIVTNFSTVWYEYNGFAILAMISNLIIIISFIKAINNDIKFEKKYLFFLVILFIVLLINGYIMFEFLERIRGLTLSVLHYSLLLAMAYGSLILCLFALWYNHKYSTKYSILSFLLILSLIFSEIFRGFWYYEIAFGTISLAISIALLIIGFTITIKLFLIETPVEDHLKLK